jgi:hypothetical protein
VITKLAFDVLDEPKPLAAVAFTLSAPPVGAVVSLTNVSAEVKLLPATTLESTVYPVGLLGFAVQLKALDV